MVFARVGRVTLGRALLTVVCVAVLAGCGSVDTGSQPPGTSSIEASRSPSSPSPSSAAASAYGSFTFSGWVTASGVGPVQPLPFATPAGAVPDLPLVQDAAGVTRSGSAPGTQCFHATSANDLDQYEVRLVFAIHAQLYLLTIFTVFGRPGARSEATPPAGGRMVDAANTIDELHFDPEGVSLSDDPMFLASFADGTVVIAPTLRSGTIDLTLRGLSGSGGAVPTVHVSGSWACP